MERDIWGSNCWYENINFPNYIIILWLVSSTAKRSSDDQPFCTEAMKRVQRNKSREYHKNRCSLKWRELNVKNKYKPVSSPWRYSPSAHNIVCCPIICPPVQHYQFLHKPKVFPPKSPDEVWVFNPFFSSIRKHLTL